LVWVNPAQHQGVLDGRTLVRHENLAPLRCRFDES
jgi:hypothetical protein